MLLRPVGTGGRAEWMRGPCVCPRADAIRWIHATFMNRVDTRTGTKPPPPVPTANDGAALELRRPLSSYVWNRRHSHSNDKQNCPGQPDGRENTHALDQDTRQG